MRVIATAGHVDHGKSTLVKALTGMDPDRLAEEKARGLTIDLGFAWTTLTGPASGDIGPASGDIGPASGDIGPASGDIGPASGDIGPASGDIELASGDIELAIVDVPGHSRFVKNMVAGVGGVACCLFVVSAVEGWMPQSEEHLRVLELAGLSGGVIALTRCAGVDGERRRTIRAKVTQAVRGTFLESAPLLETDAPAGLGVAELRYVLRALLSNQPLPLDTGRPRMYVDRAFVMKGHGTVVTGTLTGGSFATGDAVTVLEPGRRPAVARIRGIETLQRRRATAGPGERVACNLAGTRLAHIARGAVLFAPDAFELTSRFDASFHALASLRHPVTERGAFTAHIGSGEYPVRLSWLGGVRRVEPGGTVAVRVRLPVGLPLSLGDRFVLRESGRAETIGGGEVLDPAPVRPVSKARPGGRVEAIVAERGFLEAEQLWRLTGTRRRPDVGRFVASPQWLAARRQQLTDRLSSAGSTGVGLGELDEIDRDLVELLECAVTRFGRARLAPAGNGTHGGDEATDLAVDEWLAEIASAPFSPPPAASVPRERLRELLLEGFVVESNGIHFARSAVEEGRQRLHLLLQVSPGGVTLAEFRSALGTSRRYALALLEHFDATGVARRRGDVRMAGPRLCAGRR